MSVEEVQCSTQDRILTIRLNRAGKKNALTRVMYTAMADALNAAASNPEVRVVVLAGQLECFSAGNDLVDFMQSPPGIKGAPVGAFMEALSNFPKPVVAAPCGIAVGIGVTLLLHCDLVYAGEQTKFNMPFVSLGLCPEFASSYLIPRMVGHVRAAEVLMLGEAFSSATALEFGLVNAVLPNDQVEAKALEKARVLAALPPNAVRTTKAMMRRWRTAQVNEVVEVEGEAFTSMLRQPEAMEAMTAFIDKRKPDFSRFS
jgi:enoyl-CoA hydratase/carnithine racemase